VIEPEPWELGRGSKFNGRVNFALKDEKGNSESNEIDLDFTLDYRRRWHRFKSYGQLEYDTTRGIKTTDKWTLENNYNHLFSTPWFASAWLYFKHDRFADLRLRYLLGPALGYRFIESKPLNLSAEAGIFYLNDDFYDLSDEDYWGPGWNLIYDQYVWQERLQPYHSQYGIISADGSGKNLWRSWTGVRIPLQAGFVGSVEYEVEYDSEPAIDAKTTDTTLRLKLGYQW
jgi:putative salt-induced outer membrane protein YdiY